MMEAASIGRTPAHRTHQGTPQLVIVGAASRDIDRADPRGWRLGGGVSYGALLAARLGVRVGALIGLDPEGSRAHELRLLEEAGVALVPARLANGPVFENLERPHGREQIAHGASDSIPVDAMPSAWRDAPAILLAPVADELPEPWSEVPRETTLVGLAWQGLLRELYPGRPVVETPARPRPLLRRADIHGVGVDDLRSGGARWDELLPRAGQEVAITLSERGALHLRRTESGFRGRRVPAVPTRVLRDPTGAGDVFLTTWVAARLWDGPLGRRPLRPEAALFLAAVVASVSLEGVGLPGLPDARAIRTRLRELRRRAASG